MAYQTKLRTQEIEPNQNISFPIGTILSVRDFHASLGLHSVFGKHKAKGHDLNSLVQALVSYRLTENLSISQASDWINRPEVLEEFSLDAFEQRTLYRVLETIGHNHEEIISDIQDRIFQHYEFEHTDVNLDWTSLVLYGTKAKLGKYGYSRDYRPDKKQITVGVSEITSPVNVPIGVTVQPGNVNDISHFPTTYGQIRERLRKGSLVIFDKGAHSKENVEMILADKMKYLTAKKLNTSDDKRIKAFDRRKAELIDPANGVYGIKYVKPSRIDYFYFSEKLQRDQFESRRRQALRKLKEAKDIQKCLDKKKKLPKRFTVNNPLVEYSITYQTKLGEMTEDDALKVLNNAVRTGREGFFCIVSSEDLTLQEALETYRKKDSIEKIFNSLKNEIEIKPLRVWSDCGINGAIVLGFVAQLLISLMRYEVQEVAHTSTKFIRRSLMNLTVTIEIRKDGRKRRVYSNFDPINRRILAGMRPFI
jgi:transposase